MDLTGAVVTVAEQNDLQINQLTADAFTANIQGNISDVGTLTVSGAATFRRICGHLKATASGMSPTFTVSVLGTVLNLQRIGHF